MAIRDSWWSQCRFFVAIVAIIATVSVINDGKVGGAAAFPDNKNVVVDGDHRLRQHHHQESSREIGTSGAAAFAFGSSSAPAADAAARQDDYADDYFEDPDDSQNIASFSPWPYSSPQSSTEMISRSEKLLLSWADNDEPAPGQTGLVIVFDASSAGMGPDLETLKRTASALVESLNAWDRIPVFNYVLVPIMDSKNPPGPKTVTRNATKFLETLDGLKVADNGDEKCERPILKALQMGLNAAMAKSFVLVFTDALASDYELESDVVEVIREKQATVYFLSSGDCGRFDEPGFKTYSKISESNHGLTFEMKKTELEGVLTKIHEILSPQIVPLKEARDPLQLTELIVDQHVKALTVFVSGATVQVERLMDSQRRNIKEEVLFRTQNSIVIRYENLESGLYSLVLGNDCRECNILRISGLSDVILDFGFSLEHIEDLKQTTFAPTLAVKNVLSIRAQNLYDQRELTMAKLTFPTPRDQLVQELPLKFNQTTQLYETEHFIPLRTLFRVSIHGRDERNLEINRLVSGEIEGAIGSTPDLIFNEEARQVSEGEPLKIFCHVRSFGMAASLILKHDGTIIKTFFSDSDPRIVHEKSTEASDAGTYSCSVRNEFGTRTKTMQVTVQERRPQMEKSLVAVEGVDSLEIRCLLRDNDVLSWTVNSTEIQSILPRTLYSFSGDNLVLRNVQRSYSGNYSCVQNSSIKLTLDVQFPVEKAPQSHPTVVLFQVGQPFVVNCGLAGNPEPSIRWIDNLGYPQNDQQELRIAAGEERLDGMRLRCSGSNSVTSLPVHNELLLKKKMTISITQSPEPAESGMDVEFQCIVPPDQTVRLSWFVNGLSVESFGSGFVQSGPMLTVRKASPDVPLTLECVVESSLGSFKAQKRVQVTAKRGIPPAIPTTAAARPKPDPVTERNPAQSPVIDEQSFQDYYILDQETPRVSLNCRLSVRGFPEPTIYWTHNDQRIRQGPRLEINRSMREGEYYCVAENSAGQASKLLIVEKLQETDPLSVAEEVINLDEGDMLNYSCPVLSAPAADGRVSPGDIVWTSDKLNYRGGNLLLIHASPSDSGSYSCCLPRGSQCARIKLVVKAKRRKHATVHRYVEVSAGQYANLQCEGLSSFGARFEWWKSGRQVDTSRALILPGTIDSEGVYQCLSWDELNEYEAHFQVAFRELPTITKTHRNCSTGKCSFECEAAGHPLPVLAWLRDGIKVVSSTLVQFGKEMLADDLRRGSYVVVSENGERMQLTENDPELQQHEQHAREPHGVVWQISNRLNLKWVTFDDARPEVDMGQWTCVAMNKWGSSNQTVESGLVLEDGKVKNGAKDEQMGVPKLMDGESGQENVTIIQGLPLILECRANPQDYKINWTFNGAPVDDDDTIRIALSDKNDNRLIVWETAVEDAGLYECVQGNARGFLRKSFSVQIQEPPQIKPHSNTADSKNQQNDPLITRLTVAKGRSAVIQCPITGSPEPTITWAQLHFVSSSKRLTPIYTRGPNLTIRPQESTEFYQCTGQSVLGSSQALFEITTESRPAIKNSNSVKLSPKLFSGIMLPCWTEANPPANITWLHKSKPLRSSPRVRLAANSQVLRISNIRAEDNGVYTCRAENHLGRVSKTFTVQVTLPTLLSPWSKWSPCSEPCGLGSRTRSRECVFWNGDASSTSDTPQCAGEKVETEECLVTECAVDGSWSEWTEWSPCSSTCKSSVIESQPSIRYRHRDCSNPAPAFGGTQCKGASYQQEICDVPICPVDGGWSPFSAWSSCSVTCGLGMRVRNRLCDKPVPQFNGRECPGDAFEVQHCDNGICPSSPIIGQRAVTGEPQFLLATPVKTIIASDLPAQWSPWSEWSECSAPCGPGHRSRTRNCLRNLCSGDTAEFQQCEGKFCEARVKEEDTFRWLYPQQQQKQKGRKPEKLIASASATFTSSEAVEEEQEEYQSLSTEELIGGAEKASQSNYFNPKVSITLESSIPLTNDVSQIHFNTGIAPSALTLTSTRSGESCELGFEFHDGFCEDINECNHNPPVCSASQICVNVRGGFSCECDTGYEMIENNCVDIDECRRHTHDCSHTCHNIEGSYYCSCPTDQGYLLADDFHTCREDVSQIMMESQKPATQESPQREFMQQLQLENGNDGMNMEEEHKEIFYVEGHHCAEGFAVSAGGKCEDVDECATMEENCSTDQQCLNTNGGYVCLPGGGCPDNFQELHGSCLQTCATTPNNCSSGAVVGNSITHAVISLDRFDEKPLYKLASYDREGRPLVNTEYHLQYNDAEEEQQNFYLKQWKQGLAFVFATELQEERIYRVVVYGRTVAGAVDGNGNAQRLDEDEPEQLLYLHKFIIYLYRRSAVR